MIPWTGRRLLAAAGLAELALAVAASRWMDRASFPLYLGAYFGMAICWLVASHAAAREEARHPRDSAFVLAFALALRLVFLPTEPSLSGDIYRYAWDGRVQHAGINPYLYAPVDPELDFLRRELPGIHAAINHREIPTIYPPLMQAAFFLATSFSSSVLAMKAFFVLFDLALVYVLARLLAAVGLPPLRALIYGWSPLAVVEIAGSGHNEAFAVFLLVAALWAFEQNRALVSMVLLGASGMAKLASFALAPLFTRFVRPRAFTGLLLAAAPLALAYGGAGGLAFRGLREYAARWRGNDSLFHLLYAATGTLERAKVGAAVLFAGLLLLLVWKRVAPLRASFLILGALLLLSPVVHPWYLLWVAPFLALFPNPAWLYLQAAVALAYYPMDLAAPGAPWQESIGIKLLEYGPFYFLLGLDLARHESRKAARDPRGDAPG